MPFFLVYDPPAANGPYLIGTRKGGKDKMFASYSQAERRLREVGRSARAVTKVFQFTNLADATSYCVMMREGKRAAVIVTVKKKPAEAGSRGVAEDQSDGRPVGVSVLVDAAAGAGAGEGAGAGV